MVRHAHTDGRAAAAPALRKAYVRMRCALARSTLFNSGARETTQPLSVANSPCGAQNRAPIPHPKGLRSKLEQLSAFWCSNLLQLEQIGAWSNCIPIIHSNSQAIDNA